MRGSGDSMTSLDLGDPDRKREIWFFDSIDPAHRRPRLLHAGIILRLRRKKDGPGESTLKLRPARAELLIGDFRAGAGRFGKRYSVEWDWAHEKVLAASMGELGHFSPVDGPFFDYGVTMVSSTPTRRPLRNT